MGQAMSFARRNGGGIVKALTTSKRVRRGSRLLDFGCGAGHLSPYLLAAGFEVWGLDSSTDLVNSVNARNENEPRWKGALTDSHQFESGFFDVVVCIEVVEHVFDHELHPMLREINRLLKPGGVAMFTTPNNEDIEGASTCCPFCLSTFHYRQHLRSFDGSSLGNTLKHAGFVIEFCSGLNFIPLARPRPGWRDWNYRVIRSAFSTIKAELLDRLSASVGFESRAFRRQAQVSDRSPHLCAVVLKKG